MKDCPDAGARTFFYAIDIAAFFFVMGVIFQTNCPAPTKQQKMAAAWTQYQEACK